MHRVRIGAILAIPAAIALFLGAMLGGQAMKTEGDSVETARIQEVTTQTRLLIDGFWSNLEVIRTQAQTFKKIIELNDDARPEGKILHWAEFGIRANGKGLGEVIHSVANRAWKVSHFQHGDRPFEELYLDYVMQRASLRDLRENGVTIVRVRQDPQRAAEWMALVFAVPGEKSVAVALVDANDAFPVFQRFTAKSDGGSLRAYLLGPDGHVIAHSLPSYVNADFSGLPIYTQAAQAMFQGHRLNGSGTYQAIDKIPVTAAYARPGTLPIGVVVERVVSQHSAASRAVKSGGWQKVLGQIFFALGALALLIAACVRVLEWRSPKQDQESAPSPEPVAGKPGSNDEAEALAARLLDPQLVRLEEIETEDLPVLNAEPLSIGATVAGPVTTSYQHQALLRAQEENTVISGFEEEAARLKDPKQVAERLVQTSSRLCNSPTLFFVFHEGIKTAVLQTHAGFGPGEAPVGMSFPIDQKILDQVQKEVAEGRSASLVEHAPLAHILMARLGVAHFEAWAVTGYSRLGRAAGKSKLLGVLIVLQAGIDSASRHDSLSRMMRTTGLIYENALLSQ